MAAIPSGKAEAAKKLPERIGKYTITRLLGEGGMGRVYRGVDPDTNRVVAVKTILAERMASPTSLPRFLREMQILAGLDHPNIVRILDRGLVGEEHFLVMEHIEGRPLDEVVRKGPLPGRTEGLAVARKIASALAYMHSQGVMHRDLKPANIILGDDGRVTIIDFGLSRFLDKGGTVTGVGRVIGSPHYLPPEQWRGERPDHRADVYQLGVLLIELLTGKVPFSGSDLRAIMDSCLNYGISETLLAGIGITGEANDFIRRCTARRAEDRYQEMKDALADLERLERGEKLAPMPEGPTAVNSFSLDLTADSLEDVDPDAPTSVEPLPAEGKNAQSFHPPPARPAGPKGPVPSRPSARIPAQPAASEPRRLGSRPLDLRPPPETPPVIPPATVVSIVLVMVLSAALVTLATRPPPPPPLPRLVAGPRVLDGVAAARVEWETDRPTETLLELRGAGSLTEVAGEPGPRRDHQVLLTGLSPGAAYTVRVQGPQGPMGEPVQFTARGVSIAFDPLFTRNGLELRWRSEDPLVVKAEKSAGRGPGGYPSREGQLMLPGVRPGAGSITVWAVPPLGTMVLPVVWTVPPMQTYVERLDRVLDAVLGSEGRPAIDEALAARDGSKAAGLVASRARRAAGDDLAKVLAQASLALEDPGLPADSRLALASRIGELRRIERRIELLAPGEDPLPLESVMGERFRWGAKPGVPLKAKALAAWVPPPAPLQAFAGSEAPAGGSPPHALTWKLPAGVAPTRPSVTLVVHCSQLRPALWIEAGLDGLPPLTLFSTASIARQEEIDDQEAWTMVHHTLDAALVPATGAVVLLRVRSLAPELDGRQVPITRVELLDGPLED